MRNLLNQAQICKMQRLMTPPPHRAVVNYLEQCLAHNKGSSSDNNHCRTNQNASCLHLGDNLSMTYSVISQFGREHWNGKIQNNYIFLGKTLMWMTEEDLYFVHTVSTWREGREKSSVGQRRGRWGLKLGLSQSEMRTVQGKSWPSPTSLHCEDEVFLAPPSPLASLNLILIWKHLVISVQLMPLSSSNHPC